MTFKAGLQTVAMALALSWTSSAWADVVDEAEEHNEGDSAEDDDSAADDDSAVPSRAELADEIAGFETRLRDLEKRPTGVSTLSTALAGSALVFSIVALALAVFGMLGRRKPGGQAHSEAPPAPNRIRRAKPGGGAGAPRQEKAEPEDQEPVWEEDPPPPLPEPPRPRREEARPAVEPAPKARPPAGDRAAQPVRPPSSPQDGRAGPRFRPKTSEPKRPEPKRPEPKNPAREPRPSASRIAPGAMDSRPPRPRVSQSQRHAQSPTAGRSREPVGHQRDPAFRPLVQAGQGSGSRGGADVWRDDGQEDTQPSPRQRPAGRRPPDQVAAPRRASRPAPVSPQARPVVEQRPEPSRQPRPEPPQPRAAERADEPESAAVTARTPVDRVDDDEPGTSGDQRIDSGEFRNLAGLFQQLPHGEIGILLMELRQQAPRLAERFASAPTRDEFLEELDDLLEHRIQRFAQVYAQEEDVVERWVVPDLLAVLNALARFQSLGEQEYQSGLTKDRTLSDDLYGWLHGRLGKRCADEGWFGLDPVQPYGTDFDPGRHFALAGRRAPGAERKVIAVEQVGRVDPGTGRVTFKAQVVVGK